MENVLNFIKNKKNILIAVAASLLVIIAVLFIVFRKEKLTDLEKVKINEFSDRVSNYLDEILSDDADEGKYVNFAIEYLYNTTDKDEYETSKILDIINDTFDADYSAEKIERLGISESMLNKGIFFDSGKNVYKYNNQKTATDIANIPIVKYNLKKITKKSNEEFQLEYEKYYVENPYDILNYYSNDKVDTINEISNYLKGKTKISTIYKYITQDNIEKIGKIDGTKKVTLVIKNNKLLIK